MKKEPRISISIVAAPNCETLHSTSHGIPIFVIRDPESPNEMVVIVGKNLTGNIIERHEPTSKPESEADSDYSAAE